MKNFRYFKLYFKYFHKKKKSYNNQLEFILKYKTPTFTILS